MSICGQRQAEWWQFVVIVGAHIVVGWLGPRDGGMMGAHSLKTFSKSIKLIVNYLSDVKKSKNMEKVHKRNLT